MKKIEQIYILLNIESDFRHWISDQEFILEKDQIIIQLNQDILQADISSEQKNQALKLLEDLKIISDQQLFFEKLDSIYQLAFPLVQIESDEFQDNISEPLIPQELPHYIDS